MSGNTNICEFCENLGIINIDFGIATCPYKGTVGLKEQGCDHFKHVFYCQLEELRGQNDSQGSITET